MKEFRLVIYMNAPESRGFWGGRAAASPLAYYFHLENTKSKVFLGGSIAFTGLGTYYSSIKEAFETAPSPITLPHRLNCDGETVHISDTAYVYQNDDSLLSTGDNGIFWKASITTIAPYEAFSERDGKRFTLDAVRVGHEEYRGRPDENTKTEWSVLASRLVRLTHPLRRDNSLQLKVYGGNNRPRSFWTYNGTPSIPHRNAFVHMTTAEWRRLERCARAKPVKARELIDDQIKHTRIHESLVHEMLKIMFAEKGWWVNYEIPIKGTGRIDFLIKRPFEQYWRLIEVKLRDNPNAVEQLRKYIQGIKHDVRKREDDSNFWLLWNGKGCKRIKGVILCAPGDNTVAEARNSGFDVWTYTYDIKDLKLGIEVRDAKSNTIILRTG